jgi:threonine/homoserine/homoserine lactone efflux protein
MVVSAISAYTAGRGLQLYLQVAILAVICVIVTFLSTLTWAAFGAAIGRWLRAPLALHLFNLFMALLLVGSTLPILFEIWHDLKG